MLPTYIFGADPEYFDIVHRIANAHPEWVFIGDGRHRCTFDAGDGYVVKVPHCAAGVLANQEEEAIYRDGFLRHYPVAECFLAHMEGLPVLVMEKVDRVNGWAGDMPEWAGQVDCGQVGYTSRGELVAYDFSFV